MIYLNNFWRAESIHAPPAVYFDALNVTLYDSTRKSTTNRSNAEVLLYHASSQVILQLNMVHS